MIHSFLKIMYKPNTYKEISHREYKEEEQRQQKESIEPVKSEDE